MKQEILNRLSETGIVAIMRGIAFDKLLRLVDALHCGGIRLVEVTLNTNQAFQAIALLREQFGDVMNIGAGTVLSEIDAQRALDAGAQFFVTPNVDVSVIQAGVHADIPVMAGAVSLTEMYAAQQAGASFVKIFPAAAFGPEYIKAVRGPLPHIPLIAVGGVSVRNAPAFLDAGVVGFGLGGSLMDASAIASGKFDTVTEAAQSFIDLYKNRQCK